MTNTVQPFPTSLSFFNLFLLVPTFDGRKPFKLSLFKTLPALNSELTIASAVLVAFSLGAYSLGDGAALVAGANLGVSLNIQAVVLLADPNPLVPDPSDTSLTSNTPLHLRVLSETESSDSKQNDNNIGSEPTDDSPVM
jgi:hypothetical protein